MAKKQLGKVMETGTRLLYDSNGITLGEIIMSGKRMGVQMSWKGKTLTLWEDGAMGVSGETGSNYLYIH
jgi:hypothetical protein